MLKSQSETATEKISFRRGFKTEAERISIQCRSNLALKDYQPLPAFDLAKYLKLAVLTPSDFHDLSNEALKELLYSERNNHWSAITIGKDEPQMIIYNSSHSSCRTESNIMHECAHVLLKHKMGIIDTSLGIPLRTFDPVQEMEAEWLGGCLQLPTPALKKYYIYGSYTAEQIAELFNASLPMVRYRLGVSGVITMKSRFKR